MQEEFLFFIWRHRLYRGQNLQTACGQDLTVIHPGLLNRDAGPDFSYSHLRLGEIELAGQVEMHIRASDWYKHGHERDPAYRNVILHVVWEADAEVFHSKPGDLPVLILSSYTDPELLHEYDTLSTNMKLFPCASQIVDVDDLTVEQWKSRNLIDRLEEHHQRIQNSLKQLKGDWHELLYRYIGRAMGMSVNTLAMELLCQQVPYSFLARFRDRPLSIEAVLFGQAGLLPEWDEDEYVQALITEFRYWRHHFTMEALNPGVFRFMRMRPATFPTRRIAQFASLIRSVYPLSRLLDEASEPNQLLELLSVPPHPYWKEHYRFGVVAPGGSAIAGQIHLQKVVINSIVPILYSMGRSSGPKNRIDLAVELLTQLSAEKNKIISQWKGIGMTVSSAADSQALYYCFKHHCSTKNCLSCVIGKSILIGSRERNAKTS